ncbi:hypothetical protein DMA12_25950 [Amycolatopsis balhimycina DSM 5908]|uniref:Uncharacterized protein n=1 Tax=Amycolatopsis balhimycina DSM 5908 TaxID=1081091 RepID=A0A428WCZ8_AMYBA|nr:hypothetical protein DMA12_25950 [Amycolatopsis balhimycina DSM 5908]
MGSAASSPSRRPRTTGTPGSPRQFCGPAITGPSWCGTRRAVSSRCGRARRTTTGTPCGRR